jgi:starch phosphorylase
MRESMSRLSPAFSSNRAVRQYTEDHYLPLASLYAARAAAGATGQVAWEREMRSHWDEVHFGAVTVDHADASYVFHAEVHLGAIQPANVRVEIYADPLDSDEPVRVPMSFGSEQAASGPHRFTGSVPDARPAEHYTVRVVPHNPGVLIPLELTLIRWQK